jgi:hypothetical protein
MDSPIIDFKAYQKLSKADRVKYAKFIFQTCEEASLIRGISETYRRQQIFKAIELVNNFARAISIPFKKLRFCRRFVFGHDPNFPIIKIYYTIKGTKTVMPTELWLRVHAFLTQYKHTGRILSKKELEAVFKEM